MIRMINEDKIIGDGDNRHYRMNDKLGEKSDCSISTVDNDNRL